MKTIQRRRNGQWKIEWSTANTARAYWWYDRCAATKNSWQQKKRNEASASQNKQTIPKNQGAKHRKKHKCDVCKTCCGLQVPTHETLANSHSRKPYQCDVCLKSFIGKSTLNKHKKLHEPKSQFRCLRWYQRFEQESTKNEHEQLCSSRQFECDTCEYRTTNKSNLTRHMRIHSEKKSIECSFCLKQIISSRLQPTIIFRKIPRLTSMNCFVCSKCGRQFASWEDKQSL